MSHPRCVVPGAVLFLTRRTLRRTFLFRPDPVMNELFLYALAVTAEKFEIELHAVMLMSTHSHLAFTDRRGNFPAFIQELHRLVALATKVYRKWEGSVWDNLKANVLSLVTPQAIIEKLAYAVVNPVKAGLVHRSADWPGVSLSVDREGQDVIRVKRPDVWFDAENTRWPDEATLSLSWPSTTIESFGEAGAKDLLRLEIARQEEAAHHEVRAQGWRVLGARAVCLMSPFNRSTGFEPLRSLEPHLAAGRGQIGARLAAIQALQAFRHAYHLARKAWAAGLRCVGFPRGTWAMSRYHSALISQA